MGKPLGAVDITAIKGMNEACQSLRLDFPEERENVGHRLAVGRDMKNAASALRCLLNQLRLNGGVKRFHGDQSNRRF